MPPPSIPTTSTSSPPNPPRPPRRLATATAVLSTLQIILALSVAAVVQLRLRNLGTCLLGAGGSSVIVGGAGDVGGGVGVVGGVGGLETIPIPSYRGSSSSSSSSSGSSACSFAYTVSAASIFASFAVSLVRCSGVRAGLWLEGATSAALAGWWTVAAVVFSFDASRASQAGCVVLLSETLLFFLFFFFFSKLGVEGDLS